MPQSVAHHPVVVNGFLGTMNKEDKRVIRTRKRLASALVSLSCEQGYEAVTVQSITEQAGIHYRTFYRHYDSKEDLLHDVLQKIMADLQQILPPPTPEEFKDPNFEQIAREKITHLYEYVAENSVVFRVFMQSGPDALEPIQEVAQAQTEAYFANVCLEKIPYQLIANHMIRAYLSSIQWWLDHDMPYSAEEMGDYAVKLITLPVRDLLLDD